MRNQTKSFKRNPTKRRIYVRTFSALFAVYLVLMAGFSFFLIRQERKEKGMELQANAFQINNIFEEVLQGNMDAEGGVADIPKLKKELIDKSPFFSDPNTEMAIYTGDYDLVYHTDDYWRCSYTKYSVGNTSYTGYAYLDAKKWFGKKEIQELNRYLYAVPKPEKPGDLDGYSLDIEGFWLDNGMVIPDKIYITPMTASSFDKDGNATSGSGTRREDLVYRSNYQNTGGLPYFDYASIEPTRNESTLRNPAVLRSMVQDVNKLKTNVKKMKFLSYETVSPVTYRFYLVMPYQNTIDASDQKYTSKSWTVLAREINLLNQCGTTLAFVWVSCFATFLVAGLILSAQTYKLYHEREQLEKRRTETANALAHDLKTPLSIISGYAQNLIENVMTEKRGHYAAHIQENVNRMDHIVREILELSKLEANQLQTKSEEVSLSVVCAELIKRYELVCHEKALEVHCQGDAVIKADFSLIQRVIENFFINALDHTPSGGAIRMKITGGVFEIYNSGSQIPEEKTKAVWEPYIKGEESRSGTKGSGLGLSICSAVLELYHFSYGVENRDDGVVFWFRYAAGLNELVDSL